MRVEITRAQQKDAIEIGRLHVASWQVAYRGIVPDRTLDGLDPVSHADRWARNMEEPGRMVLVARYQDDLAGFCSFEAARDADMGPDAGQITAIYVGPEQWRRGVGTALLDRVLSALSVAGRRLAVLWVLEANSRARRFYERFGFRSDGQRRLAFREPPIPEIRYQLALPGRNPAHG